MEYQFDLVSIGSGSAGRRVAVALGKAGWRVAIIEKDVAGHFGGTCVSTGCIPTKALIEGIRRGDSLEKAMQMKAKIVERIKSGSLKNAEQRANVKVIQGVAKFIDKHTLDVNGTKVTSDIIVVATGSRPVIPPIQGMNEVPYYTSRELLDLEALPTHMAIIGGGRIGLEFAMLYHQLGVKITIFEGLSQILPGEDKELVGLVQSHLHELGIIIHLNTFVQKLSGSRGITITFPKNGHPTELTVDALLVSTGRIPNTEPLNINSIGIEMNRSAIKVNDFMQSSIANIFAIGDVVGNPMMTNWGSFQSGILLNNLKKSKTDSSYWEPLPKKQIPRICYIHPEYASIGLTEESARELYGDEIITYNFKNKWLGKSMILGDWVGVLKGVGRKGSDEILGVHLWGERTGSLVQMVVLAMENNLGWSNLSSLVYGHPVLVEGIYSLTSNMEDLTSPIPIIPPHNTIVSHP